MLIGKKEIFASTPYCKARRADLMLAATPVLLSILEFEKKKFGATKDISVKDNILKELLELAARLVGENKQKIFLNEVANYFKIDLTSLQRQTQQKQMAQNRLQQKNSVVSEFFVSEDDNLPPASFLAGCYDATFAREQEKDTKSTKEMKIAGFVLKHPICFSTLRKYLQYQDFSKEPLQSLMQRLFSMQDKEIASCTMADFLQFFCDDKEIVDEILLCIKILPENLSEIFWLEKWIYELKKDSIHQRFSKESLYLSTDKQKEQWQLYKLQLRDMEHLIQNSKNRRVFFKSSFRKPLN